MDKEELIEFLKENLKINLYCSTSGRLTVDISIEGEPVTSSECYLPDDNSKNYWD
jgi:hypothetical protein